MPASAYPSTLPAPAVWNGEPFDRAARSPLPGNRQLRSRSRDAMQEIEAAWLYSAAEMAAWVAWYDDALLAGMRWFSIRAPGRGGWTERACKFRTNSVRRELLGAGLFRVSARLQQRGISAAPALCNEPPVVVLSVGDSFKWLTTASAADYSAPGFDDSAWASSAGAFEGTTPFPNEPNASLPIGTTITNLGKIWLRKTIAVPAPCVLTFALYHDDAGELWVDGVPLSLTPVTSYWHSSAVSASISTPTVSIAYRVTDSIPSPITFAAISATAQLDC